jgi:signal transduction histidine kinase
MTTERKSALSGADEIAGLQGITFPLTVWEAGAAPEEGEPLLASFNEAARAFLVRDRHADPRGLGVEELLPDFVRAGGREALRAALEAGSASEVVGGAWPGSLEPRFLRALVLPLPGGRAAAVLEPAGMAPGEGEAGGSQEPFRALALKFQESREIERTALAREIHDVIGQELTMLKLDVAYYLERGGSGAAVAAESGGVGWKDVGGRIDRLLETVRRISSELRPAVLDYAGLSDAIEEEVYQMAAMTDLKVRFESTLRGERFDGPVSTATFRILQEALTNVVRHASARSVRVRLFLEGDLLALEIEDDGRGFDPLTLTRPESLGFLGMRERATALRGSLEVESEEGRGTLVRVRIPMSSGREGGRP